MEQKIIERVNNAIDMYNAKVEKFNANAEQLLNEIFTDDVKKIVKEICNYYDSKIEFRFEDNVPFNLYSDCRVSPFRGYLHLNTIATEKYSDTIISYINRKIYDYENSLASLQSIQSHAEEIVSRITKMYEDKVNKQMDELDKIFQKLSDGEMEIKHIKITVEWV